MPSISDSHGMGASLGALDLAREVLDRCGDVAIAIDADAGSFEYGIHVSQKGRWSVSYLEDEVVWDAVPSKPSQRPSDFDGCVRLIAAHLGSRLEIQISPSTVSRHVVGWN